MSHAIKGVKEELIRYKVYTLAGPIAKAYRPLIDYCIYMRDHLNQSVQKENINDELVKRLYLEQLSIGYYSFNTPTYIEYEQLIKLYEEIKSKIGMDYLE
jgi:hypothetical protein